MKDSEAAVILCKIAAYDRRTIGEADATAWAEALDGLVTIEDALTAVRDHFRESTEWIMPKHVIERSGKLRSKRIRESGLPDYPAGLTQAQEREWLTVWHRYIGNDRDAATAQRFADEELSITRVESMPADPARVQRLMAEFAKNRQVTA